MIPAFLITRFGPAGAKVAFFGAIAFLVALLLLLSYCTGRRDGKSGEVVREQQREIKVQGQIGNANENASTARVEDAVKTNQQTKELNDALKATQDPDGQRALRGCVILREQGRDTSRIAACSGSANRP